ncbi:helix-turn-helix domain-containing protein [Streptomyces sp. NPDC004393]
MDGSVGSAAGAREGTSVPRRGDIRDTDGGPRRSGVAAAGVPSAPDRLPPLTIAPATVPDSRLLLVHLDTDWALSAQPGQREPTRRARHCPSCRRDSSTHAPPPPCLSRALHGAATAHADSRLRDPGLTPATITRALNVAVRTLYRAFADGETVMAYVRRRRLEGARRELGHRSSAYTVADVAARWRFADTTHSRRAYRTTYGRSPRRRENRNTSHCRPLRCSIGTRAKRIYGVEKYPTHVRDAAGVDVDCPSGAYGKRPSGETRSHVLSSKS